MNASFYRALAAAVVALAISGCSATRARTVEIESPPHSRVVLTASAWTLTELNGEKVTVPAGSTAPNIHFDRDTMRVSGNAGVNRFSGTYSLQNETLTFSPLAATKMAGPDELNSLETRFLQAMQETDRWRIDGDTLEFSAGDRVVARFEKMPATK